MKKALCFVMAMMLLFACCACSGNSYSQYGKSAVLEVSSPSAKAGSTVKVDIALQNNPGTSVVSVELKFDPSVLIPVSMERSGKIKGVGFYTSSLDGQDEYGMFENGSKDTVKGIFFDAKDFKGNGKIMTVTFKVADDAAAGEYPVTIVEHADDLVNQNSENVDVVYLNGAVKVS